MYAHPARQLNARLPPRTKEWPSRLGAGPSRRRATASTIFEGAETDKGEQPIRRLPVQDRLPGNWRVLEATSTNCLDDPAIGGIVVNAHDVTEQEDGAAAASTTPSKS